MARRTKSELVMELLDRVSEPARRISESLRGVTDAVGNVGQRQTAMADRVQAAMDQNNRAVARARGGMVDAVAGAYVLARGLSAPVRAAANFQESMIRVGTLTGAADEQLERMNAQARELGRTTMFSASEAADGMGFLAQAGFDAEEIMAAMPGTLQLAAAGNIELSRAADIASNVLSGYGMEVDRLGHVNDVLASTFTSTNTDLNQLAQAMVYAGPVASSAGLRFEETAAAIGLMGNAGIQGSMAGTALRGAITRILNPTKSVQEAIAELGVDSADAAEMMEAMEGASDDIAAEMERAGLSFTDAEGRLRPMAEIIEQLEPHADNTGLMMKLFGQRAGPAMAALVSQGSDELVNLTEQLEDSGGTAERVADAQMEGFNGRLRAMRSAVEGLNIAIGNALLPGLTRMTEAVTRGLRPVTELAEAYPRVTEYIVAATAGLVAFRVAALGLRYLGLQAKGGLLMLAMPFARLGDAISRLGRAAWSMIALQTALGRMDGRRLGVLGRMSSGLRGMALAVPGVGKVAPALGAIAAVGLGKAAAAIAAIAVGGFAIHRYWDRIGAIFEGVGRAVRERLQPAFDWLRDNLSGMRDTMRDGVGWVAEQIGVDADAAQAAFDRMFDVGAHLESMKRHISRATDWVRNVFGGMFDRELLDDDQVEGIASRTEEIAGRIIDSFVSLPSTMLRIGEQMGERMWEGIGNRFPEVAAWAEGMPGKIADGFLTLPSTLLRIGSEMGERMWEGIGNRFPAITQWAEAMPGKIADGFLTLPSTLLRIGSEMGERMWEGIGDRFPAITAWAEGLPAKISDRIQTDGFMQIGRDMLQGLWDGMRERVGGFITWVATIPLEVIDSIAGTSLADTGRAFLQSLWDGMRDGFNAFISWVGDIPAAIRNAIGNIDLSNLIRFPERPAWLGGTGGSENPNAGPGGRVDGARARGGRVSRGGDYLVGERGFEIFSPTRSGYIFPHQDAMDRLRALASNPIPGVRMPEIGGSFNRIASPFQSSENQMQIVTDIKADGPGGDTHIELTQNFNVPVTINGNASQIDVQAITRQVRIEMEREMREAMRTVMADVGVRTY